MAQIEGIMFLDGKTEEQARQSINEINNNIKDVGGVNANG